MRSYSRVGDGLTEKENIKNFIKHVRSKKKLWIIALGALLGGALLMIGAGAENEEKSLIPSSEQDILSYEKHLETRIAELIEGINGISRVHIMVTLEGGFENVYANDGSFLTVGSGSTKAPVLIKQILPSVRGVGIVCDKADDPIIQREICELLSSALGISSNRIYIAKGK